MTARLPQSGTSVSYRIKPSWASKILVLYWPAGADSVHRLRAGNTSSTVITRSTSGATYDSGTGRISGVAPSSYFTDSIAGGYGGMNEASDWAFGAAYFGDSFYGHTQHVMFGTAPPNDPSSLGAKILVDTYIINGNVQGQPPNSVGAPVADDVFGQLGIAIRSKPSASSDRQQAWVNGALTNTLSDVTPSGSSALIGDTSRPVYFGATNINGANAAKTRTEFEAVWIGRGTLTDADMVAITNDPSILIEEAVADVTPPTMTGSLTVNNVTTTSMTVDWSGTTRNDDVAITGYEYSLDGTTWFNAGTGTSKNIIGLSPSTSYNVRIRAKDDGGNASTPALSITQVTSAATDSTAPVMVGSLTISSINSGGFTISWSAATDAVGVTGYEVACDTGTTPNWVDVGNVLTITETGKASSTLYNVKVRARDAANNKATPLTTTATTTPPVSPGTITTKPICNNTGLNYGAVGVASFSVYSLSTGALVIRKTGLSLNSSSILVVSDELYVSDTDYWYEMELANGATAMDTVTAV